MQLAGTRLFKGKGSKLNFSFSLICADQAHNSLWTLRRLSKYCTVTYICWSTRLFWTGKARKEWNIYLLAFPENPGIKEELRMPESEAHGSFCTYGKARKVWKIVSWLSGLFQELLESQGSMDTLGFSHLFLSFSAHSKNPAKPGIFC